MTTEKPSTDAERSETAVAQQAVVRRWNVQCGDMNEIVEADSREEAAAKLFTMFDDYELDELPEPGLYVSTIEVIGDEVWELAEHAMRRAGRLAGSTDASTAEKPSSENQRNSGSKASAEQPAETCISSE